jgi:hypothetical protein
MTRSAFLSVLTLVFLAPAGLRAEDDARSKLEAIKQRLAGEKHDLRYKFEAGETMRYEVLHLVVVDTKILETRQEAKTRSLSTKVWKVEGVDDKGNATIIHSVSDLDMWNRIHGEKLQESRYNSKTDDKAPLGYESVAKSVGVPLCKVVVNPQGQVTGRQDLQNITSPAGDVLPPLPPNPVKVGDRWYSPLEVRLKDQAGEFRRIKTRRVFELAEVTDGIATISVTPQILTPFEDAQIRMQLIKRMNGGEIKFDIARGRILTRDLDLDETVIGFNGAASIMQYVCCFREKLLSGDSAADKVVSSK